MHPANVVRLNRSYAVMLFIETFSLKSAYDNNDYTAV